VAKTLREICPFQRISFRSRLSLGRDLALDRVLMEPRSQILGGIFYVAPRLVCSTLNLIELAFGLQAFIARERTNSLLDAAAYFLEPALHMVFAHRFTSNAWDARFGERGCSLCL
jgi:hypothetical protein